MERYRFFPGGEIYFVTFSVVEWLPVFISERACRIVTESFDYCHEHKGLRLNAYVIMPTHLHAIVFRDTVDPVALKATLTDFRKFTARTLIDHCAACMPACYDQVFVDKAGKDRRRAFWQPTLHPEQIETQSFWIQKLDYLHDNPCRKGLVDRAEHWRFSSARQFLSDHPVAGKAILSRIDW